MCTFKVSKKPNIMNLQFKCAPPLELLGGGQKINVVLRAYFNPPLHFIFVRPWIGLFEVWWGCRRGRGVTRIEVYIYCIGKGQMHGRRFSRRKSGVNQQESSPRKSPRNPRRRVRFFRTLTWSTRWRLRLCMCFNYLSRTKIIESDVRRPEIKLSFPKVR